MVAAENDRDCFLVVLHQARQLQHALARKNDLRILHVLQDLREGANRQTMPVGGYRAQPPGAQLPVHAVEVIAHILLRHGKSGPLNQATQLALLQSKLMGADRVLDAGEFLSRKGGQRKAAAATAQNGFVLGYGKLQLGAIGQVFANIRQLACRHGNFAGIALGLQSNAPKQLDFVVCAGNRQAIGIELKQHIGQHRQGLATLNDTRYKTERFEERFSRNSEFHR